MCWSRWKEALGPAAVAAALAPLVTRIGMSVLFLVHPLSIRAALRLQFAGSMVCVTFASTMATIAATDRGGPLKGLSREEVMINLQVFNGGCKGVKTCPRPRKAMASTIPVTAVTTTSALRRGSGGTGERVRTWARLQ